MHTLLLCLAGPLQSWGVQSRFTERDTGMEPSKSGVIGLLCAAQGLAREPADVWLPSLPDDLRMGVRIDRQGALLYDFHTAQNVRIAKEKAVNLQTGKGLKTSVSRRYYLADAAFLVGLESDNLAFLRELHAALRNPRWPLYLGRKAFVPGEPVYLKNGLRESVELRAALEEYPWLGRDERRYEWLKGENPRGARLVLEDPNGNQVRPDRPISFAERRFAPRRVKTDWTDDWPPFDPQQYEQGELPCTSPV